MRGTPEESPPPTSREAAPATTSAPPSRPRSRRARLRRLTLHLFVFYAVICIALFALQRRIQYPRDPAPVALPAAAADRGVREVPLTTSDGLTLTAWFHPLSTSNLDPTAPLIVFFPGNGGNRGWRYGYAQMLRAQGASILQVEYRGYGGNPGTPTEEGLYRDADAAISWARAHSTGKVIALGESLGTGVAVEMAARHSLDGLIIHAGYTSTVDVGGAQFWFLPVGWLMHDRFESVEKIGAIPCPKLFFHGKQDRVIPIRFGEQLFRTASEPKEWIAIAGAGHNDLWIVDLSRYFSKLREFVAAVTEE